MGIISERMNANKQISPQDPKGIRRDSSAINSPMSNMNLGDNSKDDGFFGSFFAKKPTKKPGSLEAV
jgi:hypothetical protein